jgi:hypothetical protein
MLDQFEAAQCRLHKENVTAAPAPPGARDPSALR